MTLAELRNDESAVLTDYDPAMPLERRQRFEDLGLTRDTPIRRERQAPLGDPIVFRVRGTSLCVRRSEARFIWARPAPRRGSHGGAGRNS